MMHSYFEILPIKYLWLGGSSGGGGGGGGNTTAYTTSKTAQENTTKNELLPWSGYVPPETYAAYQKLIPQLEKQSTQGLTPQEQAFYTGQGMNKLAQGWGAAQKELTGNLARSGARGPAVNETYGDLARSKILGSAGVVSGVQGMDIAQKGVNLDRLLKAIALPSTPVIAGTQSAGTGALAGTNLTNYAAGKSGGGSS